MANRAADGRAEDEVLFEWQQVGGTLRVAAIDPATGVEVVVFGPASAGAAALRRLAARKLAFRLARTCEDRARGV
jgi:hypothetical protein